MKHFNPGKDLITSDQGKVNKNKVQSFKSSEYK